MAAGRELVMSFGEMLIDFVPTVAWVSLAEAPANIAVAVSRLGDDEFGRMLDAVLRDNGVVFDSGARTAVAFVGKLGDDEFGRMLAAIPRDNGVVFDSGARTALGFVGKLRDGEFGRMLAAILRDNVVAFDSGARTMLSFVTVHADGKRDFMFYRNTSAADELNIELTERAQGTFIVAHDNQDLEAVQCSRQPIKMGEIMESCRRAYKSLMPQILQVIFANNDATAGQLKEQKKRWSNYAMKALFFAITMFSASVYQNQSTPAAFTLGYTLFLVSIFVSVVMDATLIILLPSWGNILVITSWLLLQVASCLVTLSFNGHYALAILAVLSLILFLALLQPKLQHTLEIFGLLSSTKGGDTKEETDDEENQCLEHLFDLAQGIANCGGLVTAIFGHYMVGPVTAAGFFFFCSISLGLYIMMVITVRAVARPHVLCLAIVLMVLLVVTLITVSIPFARHSERNPQVVKYSNHRKTLDIL